MNHKLHRHWILEKNGKPRLDITVKVLDHSIPDGEVEVISKWLDGLVSPLDSKH